jgi:hypothetical protein
LPEQALSDEEVTQMEYLLVLIGVSGVSSSTCAVQPCPMPTVQVMWYESKESCLKAVRAKMGTWDGPVPPEAYCIPASEIEKAR